MYYTVIRAYDSWVRVATLVAPEVHSVLIDCSKSSITFPHSGITYRHGLPQSNCVRPRLYALAILV